jgi:hypothetical protein
MNLGDLYNPRRLYYGAFIPDWLLRRTEVSPGVKVCFAQLCRLVDDETGTAEPELAALAAAIGVTARQTRSYIQELKQLGLVRVRQRGLGQTNVYAFVWHAWCESALLRTGASASERTDTAAPDRKNTSAPDRKHPSGPSSLSTTTRRTTPPPTCARAHEAAAQDEQPTARTERDYRAEAVQLLRQSEDETMRYLGLPASGPNAELMISEMELHLRAGRTITVAQIAAAVTAAFETWQEKVRGGSLKGRPRTIKPVLGALTDILSPLPKGDPDESTPRRQPRADRRPDGGGDEAWEREERERRARREREFDEMEAFWRRGKP